MTLDEKSVKPKIVEIKKSIQLCSWLLFYGLKQAIYTQLVVICVSWL
jgi:hypothetical protein